MCARETARARRIVLFKTQESGIECSTTCWRTSRHAEDDVGDEWCRWVQGRPLHSDYELGELVPGFAWEGTIETGGCAELTAAWELVGVAGGILRRQLNHGSKGLVMRERCRNAEMRY